MIIKNIIIINGEEVDFEKLSKDEQENVSLKLNKRVAQSMGFICQQVDKAQIKKIV